MSSEEDTATYTIPEFVERIVWPDLWCEGERRVHGARVWVPAQVTDHSVDEIPEPLKRRKVTDVFRLDDCIAMVLDALRAIELGESPVQWCWPDLIRNARITPHSDLYWLEGDQLCFGDGYKPVRLPVLAMHPTDRWLITLHGQRWLRDGEIEMPDDQETIEDEARPSGGMP